MKESDIFFLIFLNRHKRYSGHADIFYCNVNGFPVRSKLEDRVVSNILTIRFSAVDMFSFMHTVKNVIAFSAINNVFYRTAFPQNRHLIFRHIGDHNTEIFSLKTDKSVIYTDRINKQNILLAEQYLRAVFDLRILFILYRNYDRFAFFYLL